MLAPSLGSSTILGQGGKEGGASEGGGLMDSNDPEKTGCVWKEPDHAKPCVAFQFRIRKYKHHSKNKREYLKGFREES